MMDWPKTLIEDLARRRSIIVVGSGISRHSTGVQDVRPPNWKQFLFSALADCPTKAPDYIKNAIETGDYLHACEWLKVRYDESWPTYLRMVFQKPKFQPAIIHQHIIALDSRIVFSLNFDDIYERAANSAQAGSYIVKNYYDHDVSEFLRGNGRYIVKVHGSLHSPERLIFTQKEYAEARTKNSSFYQAFDAGLMSHSFIFLGSGYADPDINLILENQRFSFPNSHPHYFITSTQSNPDLKNSLRQNRNLKTIEYDKIDDNHTGLVSELENLVELVEAEREALTKSLNW